MADPWERLHFAVPSRSFGAEAPEDWRAFLSAPSTVQVLSMEDIRGFLLGCRSTLQDPPHGTGPWPTLEAFELSRSGDCTAHASWAWRKLVDLGYDAELVGGRTAPFAPEDDRHAWVVFRENGTEYLLEAVVKDTERLVRPLAAVKDRYRPEVGVDSRGARFAFAGAVVSMQHGAV